MYIVKLEDDVWFNGFTPDPCITTIKEWALQFKKESTAKRAITYARKFGEFKNAKIQKID